LRRLIPADGNIVSGRQRPVADLLGHSSEIGSIKPGKYADLIAVSGDPLNKIGLLENLEFVMKEGKVYKQGGAAACRQ